jgi:hypothetical protein
MKSLAIAFVAAAGVFASAQSTSAQVVWHQPAPVFFPAPVHVVHSPVVVSPMPVVRHYHRPVVVHQPMYRAVTRHRPILGGSVTRVHRGYRPIVF